MSLDEIVGCCVSKVPLKAVLAKDANNEMVSLYNVLIIKS